MTLIHYLKRSGYSINKCNRVNSTRERFQTHCAIVLDRKTRSFQGADFSTYWPWSFDANHDSIKTERRKDFFLKVYIYDDNILKLVVEISTTAYALKTQIDNNFWRPLADLFFWFSWKKLQKLNSFMVVSWLKKWTVCYCTTERVNQYF